MGDWFTESFGEDYKVVYRHRNRVNAVREIGAMMGWLNLGQGFSVLDVGCGMGRHSLALQAMGYEVTGFDLSDVLLSDAKCADSDKKVTWVRGDMRCLPFDDGTFQATVNWFTSFGYFADFEDNLQVLREMNRVLKPNGRFLIDYLNPAFLRRHLVPITERVDEPTGLKIIERRSIEDDFVVKKIEMEPPADASGGRATSRQYVERVRLIGLEPFKEMLGEAGLVLEQVFGDYDGNRYEADNSERLILLGRRSP